MMKRSASIQQKTLSEVGERFIKKRIMERFRRHPSVLEKLHGGLGHDSGVVRTDFQKDEVLLVNTDKSGTSKAFNLGLANGECIGDFAVSHAVSDILAGGGKPFAVSVAMLLPDTTEVSLVDQIVDGIATACMEYEMVLSGGDTKKAESISLIVTALGKAREKDVLFRNGAKVGDKLVVSGDLGSFLLGSIIHKRGHEVDATILEIVNHSLIYQKPPFRLALAMNRAGIASSCTDISDGLPSACRNLVEELNLGAIIHEQNIPIHPSLKEFSKSLDISLIQLSMAGGDWRFLYCVSEENLQEMWSISASTETKLTIVGEVTNYAGVWVKARDGSERRIKDIEHDAFMLPDSKKSYFDYLSCPREILQ